jgi:tetraacyldisaccharide 4'-kinase
MRGIKQKIEAVIYGRDAVADRPLRVSLFLLSLLYGTAIRMRTTGYRLGILKSRRLPCKVISVGNIVAGGTGKTPLSVFVTEKIRSMGYTVVVLSRGYRGAAEASGGLVSDGERLLMDVRTAGDEPYMMAMHLKDLGVPVMVGRSRFDTGSAAIEKFHPDVVVLDDAFQHLRLARDLDLVLLDGREPFANGYLLPRGPLREPLSALARGAALILTRSSDALPDALPDPLQDAAGQRPLFQARFVPYVARIISSRSKHETPPAPDTGFLRAVSVYAFSGLARNDRFQETLKSLGAEMRGFAAFADHHAYSDAELASIWEAARKTGAEYLVTSEKDWVRIAHKMPLPMDLVVLGVRPDFDEDTEAFVDFIREELARNKDE